ncbi:hypothetical protein KDA_70620 [Dictyobacter alpinus]|uniref:Uncharacterized protein n=1 Tax=Dictyobacter alpinus TaxID=2014873 RepID=A0A402BJP8_9CHLR|nr:hypothetical protein [Dictyobacter alpinus]GCE31578.1 hypothetical protein KDA_70620 [Dictyobacter alpinus]
MHTRTWMFVILRILFFVLLLTGIVGAAEYQPDPARVVGPSSTSATYRDKTTAGLLSEIAGVLTGYEFVRSAKSATPNNPTSPLADSWYQNGSFDDLMNGSYSGNNPNWQPSDTQGHEMPFATNHPVHFTLAPGLHDVMAATDHAQQYILSIAEKILTGLNLNLIISVRL